MYYSGVIDDSVGQLISAERWYLLKKKKTKKQNTNFDDIQQFT